MKKMNDIQNERLYNLMLVSKNNQKLLIIILKLLIENLDNIPDIVSDDMMKLWEELK